MRSADLADPGWIRATARDHHRAFGLAAPPARIELLDARVKCPLGSGGSGAVRGWASVRADGATYLLRGDATDTETPMTGTALPGLPLRVWRFPRDPGLPGLVALSTGSTARLLLPADLTQDRVERVSLVRWRPGTGATVRCTLRQLGRGRPVVRTVYGKLLGPGGAEAALEVLSALAQTPSQTLRVPRPLGLDAQQRVIWTEDVGGHPLLPGLGVDILDLVAAALGRSLADLHRTDPAPTRRRVTPEDVAAEARKKARKIALARPARGGDVARLAALAEEVTRATAPPDRLLHGDCHLGQVQLTREGLVLLDLDDAAVGDPAVDLAELGVDLALRSRRAGDARRFLRGVRQGYTRAGGDLPAPGVLSGYAAAELLNRCYRHLRRPSPGWEAALDADLAAAEGVLGVLGVLTVTSRSRAARTPAPARAGVTS